jgi:hypothetical protein
MIKVIYIQQLLVILRSCCIYYLDHGDVILLEAVVYIYYLDHGDVILLEAVVYITFIMVM